MGELPEVNGLELERRDDTLVIWFNRPETRNALSAAVAEDLRRVFEALPAASQYRFVVLRGGAGKALFLIYSFGSLG